MKPSLYIFLLILWGMTSPSFGQVPEWQIERIDCPKQFTDMTDRHMRLDTLSLPHLVYGKDHLYYAWFDGDSWNHETVDNADRAGKAASLALDGSGGAHVSYSNSGAGTLKYAHGSTGGWILETVDTTVGYTTSIVLAADETPRISYYDPTDRDLRYAHKEDSGWIIDIVDAKGEVGIGSSLALDSSDNPHISYGDYEDDRLLYAFIDGSGWSTEVVESEIDFSFQTSLALGDDGSIHICYADWQLCVLKYASKAMPTGDWRIETICPVSDKTPTFSLTLDGEGTPHVAFRAWGDLNLAFRDEEGWQSSVLSDENGAGHNPSLTIEEDGSLHVSFYEVVNSELHYLKRVNDVITVQTVDAEGSAGQNSSIVITSTNSPHIAYFNYHSSNELKYAYEDQRGWNFEIVDGSGTAGHSCSIAMDPFDNTHIAYNEGIGDELKYARKDQMGWTITTIDADGDVGHWVSLALDADNYPHISYSDWTYDGDMKYAYEDASGWHTETYDDSWLCYGRNAIAVDTDGYPHIIYVPFPSMELMKYAWLNEEGWHLEVFEQGDFQDVSIAIDADDVTHVCYTAWENHALVYAYREDETWHTEIVDTEVSMLSSPAITLDIAGYPHISYARSVPHQDLGYAYKDALGWHVFTADPDGHSYQGTDIALDDYGIPHISYHNSVVDDLVYVKMIDPITLFINWSLSDGSLHISWAPRPDADAYWIYGAVHYPHFNAGFAPGYEHRLEIIPQNITSWTAPGAPGDPDNNWTYLVMAVDSADNELIRSRRIGEFDSGIDIP